MNYLKKNYSWMITSAETFTMGYLFLTTNHFIDRPPHTPQFLSIVDNPPYAITLMIIGAVVFLYCSSNVLTGRIKDVVIFSLSAIWGFYSIIFIVHDYGAPGPFILRFTTWICLFILARIMLEVWVRK